MREILCWVLLLLAAYPLLRRCSSGKKPVRTGLVSSALGFAGLAAASILSPVTGVTVAVNFFTAAVAVLLGVVCVTALAMI